MRVAVAAGAAGLLVVGGLSACAGEDSSDAPAVGKTTSLPANAASGAPIKVGYITPEGGPISIPAVREGGEAAVQYLNNNAGGIAGHKIDLVVCKEHEEPASATKCANEMVEQKVDVVVSPFGSQGAVMVPIIAKAGLPYVAQAPVSQAEMATPGVFMLTGGVVAVLAGQATTAAKAGAKKVTLLIGDTGDAASSVKALGDPIFKRAGVELNVVTIPTSVADPTPQITAALADKPDAVSILGESGQCTSALKAMKTVAPDVNKYLISSCIDKSVLDAIGKDSLTGAKAFTTVNVDADDPSVELYRTVMAKYAPKADPAGLAYLGYQVVMSVAAAGKTLTGEVNAAAVKNAMAATKQVPLPAAPGINFTCDGTAFPPLTALCSRAILVSDVTAEGRLANTSPVNN